MLEDAAFDIRALRVDVAGRCLFACGALTIPAHALTTIIGPNGAGKSTLLRALAGFHGRCDGTLFGRALGGKALADGRSLAWVAQHPSAESPLSLADYILLGRRPHLGRWGQAQAGDRQAVDALMAELELERLAGRPLATLSGGERQLAAIARAVVQDAPLLLLDEPGNHLDIRHQHVMMCMLQRLAGQGRTVICVLHDLTLAANYAQHMLLVADGALALSGSVEQVLQTKMLSRLYRWPIRPRRHPDSGLWQVETQAGTSAGVERMGGNVYGIV